MLGDRLTGHIDGDVGVGGLESLDDRPGCRVSGLDIGVLHREGDRRGAVSGVPAGGGGAAREDDGADEGEGDGRGEPRLLRVNPMSEHGHLL
ncbi:hypothetical protein [Rathayibacter tritici]|uniref:hypothetical protein n=1 Tax=Rathayibacter tritici TaxID=33888 RepID=UPI001F3E64FB|nr:hypothetical protein [Rathayibacter tritici]